MDERRDSTPPPFPYKRYSEGAIVSDDQERVHFTDCSWGASVFEGGEKPRSRGKDAKYTFNGCTRKGRQVITWEWFEAGSLSQRIVSESALVGGAREEPLLNIRDLLALGGLPGRRSNRHSSSHPVFSSNPKNLAQTIQRLTHFVRVRHPLKMDPNPQGEESLRALREALALTPDNVPLRQHLADTLLGYGRAEEAEKEFRAALAMSPEHPGMKLGLARAFDQQGKTSHAIALLDELVKDANAPGRAFVLHAKLLYKEGDVSTAVTQYRRGIDRDPSAVDEDFSNRLGINSREEEENDVVEGKVRMGGWDEPQAESLPQIERPKLTFKDVGGMDAVKEEIQLKIVHPLNHPEMYKAYGKKVGGGILMYGPPGCGKTHLARATAGEINAGFIAVGINDVLEMWLGNSERNLHDLFEQARQNKPCVLFFDEVDALGASRNDMRQSAGRHLINQFLSELDGVKSDNDGVLILGATNAPWHLDSAFRRPGRFDRVIFIPPPDATARCQILDLHLRDKPIESIDHKSIAKKTDGFSGADMSAVVDIAVEAKLRDAIKEGIPKPITTKDLTRAASQLKPTTREWFSTARNHALYANQGGIYDDILKYLKM